MSTASVLVLSENEENSICVLSFPLNKSSQSNMLWDLYDQIKILWEFLKTFMMQEASWVPYELILRPMYLPEGHNGFVL